MSAVSKALKRTTVVSGIVNCILAVVKIAAGVFTGAKSLIADGLHSLSDVVTDVISYLILNVSRNEADENHPYGHGKFETFGTMFLAVALLLTALFISYDALHDLILEETNKLSPTALWIALFSVIANEGLFFYCLHIGKKHHSKMIIANAWHHRTDSLSSVAVVIGIGLSLMGLPEFDAIAAIVVGLIIGYAAIKLGLDAFNELVEAAAPQSLLDDIEKTTLATEGVLGCHNLRARMVGGHAVADLHLEVNPFISVTEGHLIADSVEKRLIQNIKLIEDVVVHIDPKAHTNIDTLNLPSRQRLERKITETLVEINVSAQLLNVYLNFLNEGIQADLVFSENLSPTEKDKLSQALKKENIYHILFLIKA